jgi:hypothetical protein
MQNDRGIPCAVQEDAAIAVGHSTCEREAEQYQRSLRPPFTLFYWFYVGLPVYGERSISLRDDKMIHEVPQQLLLFIRRDLMEDCGEVLQRIPVQSPPPYKGGGGGEFTSSSKSLSTPPWHPRRRCCRGSRPPSAAGPGPVQSWQRSSRMRRLAHSPIRQSRTTPPL